MAISTRRSVLYSSLANAAADAALKKIEAILATSPIVQS
jgi:hypothetical protein